MECDCRAGLTTGVPADGRGAGRAGAARHMRPVQDRSRSIHGAAPCAATPPPIPLATRRPAPPPRPQYGVRKTGSVQGVCWPLDKVAGVPFTAYASSFRQPDAQTLVETFATLYPYEDMVTASGQMVPGAQERVRRAGAAVGGVASRVAGRGGFGACGRGKRCLGHHECGAWVVAGRGSWFAAPLRQGDEAPPEEEAACTAVGHGAFGPATGCGSTKQRRGNGVALQMPRLLEPPPVPSPLPAPVYRCTRLWRAPARGCSRTLRRSKRSKSRPRRPSPAPRRRACSRARRPGSRSDGAAP